MKAEDLRAEFPTIDAPCDTCHGTGKFDESVHGSPHLVECSKCKGTGRITRSMTVNEKLSYLLDPPKEGQMEIVYFKESGKYYSTGHLDVPKDYSFWDVVERMKHLSTAGALPGLTSGARFDAMWTWQGVPHITRVQ